MNISWDLGKDVTHELLIENLGGYEKAKVECEARKRSGIAPMGLERSLLQYRREHGIYEVGDCIVDTISNQFFRIIEVDRTDLLVEQLFWVSSIYQRHATDEEIEAGKRLEVGDGLS